MSSNDKPGKKITIAHFMPWVGIGGVEIATLRIVEATRHDFRHVAFCLPEASVLKSSFEALGVHTLEYTPPDPSLRHAGRFYKASREIAHQIREAEVDIVHFAETKASEHNSLAAFLAGSRILCHVRNTYPELTLRNKASLLPVHAFIFVAKEARRQFGLSLPDRRARVIYDAIDIPAMDVVQANVEVRQELDIPLSSPVVGMVARVNPAKRLLHTSPLQLSRCCANILIRGS